MKPNYIDHLCDLFAWQLSLVDSPSDFWDACVMADNLKDNK